jgi:ATPase family associated with various cellular activities (AAA)
MRMSQPGPHGQASDGVLMAGPPGTGKTLPARAVAGEQAAASSWSTSHWACSEKPRTAAPAGWPFGPRARPGGTGPGRAGTRRPR